MKVPKINIEEVREKIADSKIVEKGKEKAEELQEKIVDSKIIEKGKEKAEELQEKIADSKIVEKGKEKAEELQEKIADSKIVEKGKEKAEELQEKIVDSRIVGKGRVYAKKVRNRAAEIGETIVEKEEAIRFYSAYDELPQGQMDGDIQPGCLLIEGGAFRGMYNQGVLDFFLQNNINIHTVAGVSAGALAGMNYVSGQLGRSVRINLKYRHDSRFVGMKALRKAHSILDVDFLLKTCETEYPLNAEKFYSPDRRYVAVATDCTTGKPAYFEKDSCKDLLAGIKASASMPYISPMVDVDGVPCLDGGCSTKVPVDWALEQGFEKIVVIRTRERGYRKAVSDRQNAARIYRNYPEFAAVLDESNASCNREYALIEELEKEGRVFVIAPSAPITVGRLEPDLEKLGELYWQGYHDAEACLEELKEYLGIEG